MAFIHDETKFRLESSALLHTEFLSQEPYQKPSNSPTPIHNDNCARQTEPREESITAPHMSCHTRELTKIQGLSAHGLEAGEAVLVQGEVSGGQDDELAVLRRAAAANDGRLQEASAACHHRLQQQDRRVVTIAQSSLCACVPVSRKGDQGGGHHQQCFGWIATASTC